MTDAAVPAVLLTENEVTEPGDALPRTIAPHIDDETVAVCLLTGGLWFCADLTRALSRQGRNIGFDALWLAVLRREAPARAAGGGGPADRQRPVAGRTARVVEAVSHPGRSLPEAARLVRDAGAAE